MTNVLQAISARIVVIVERYLPEPFAFAILMTAVTLLLALAVTPASPTEVLVAWGEGLSALLPFITQMALMLLFAYALAHLGPVPRLLERLATIPKTPAAAYAMVTLFTGTVSLINWPLGLISGALLARATGRSARSRGLPVHYPLLGGAAFGGFVVWHMGYSASAPLFVATPGNAMEAQLGGLIPVSDTIFATWNLITAGATLLAVAATAVLLHPRSANDIQSYEQDDADATTASPPPPQNPSPAVRLETSRIPTTLMGLLLATYLVYWFATRGLQLDLNVVNWTFLALGLLLAASAREYSEALVSGGRAAAPILLQYPLYGGVMGIMLGTGFVTQVAPLFTRFATETTLPLIAFLFGGLVNFFIPSGGAQWTVQGPAFVAAAAELGTELPLIVMGVAYGDQWTNIIHPFTVIPVMILTGLQARQILAYSAVLFLTAGVTLGLGLYLAALI